MGELSPNDWNNWLFDGSTATRGWIEYLKVLIEQHHSTFSRIYPGSSIIPKMHYLVHMPRLIYQLVFMYHNYVHNYSFFKIWTTCSSMDNALWGKTFIFQKCCPKRREFKKLKSYPGKTTPAYELLPLSWRRFYQPRKSRHWSRYCSLYNLMVVYLQSPFNRKECCSVWSTSWTPTWMCWVL